MSAITDWLPEWVPGLIPAAETARWAAAALGVLLILVFAAALYRRVRGPAPARGDLYEKRLIRIALVLAPIMLGLAFIGSFHAVYHLADARDVEPAWVPPLAIDGILVLFLVVDLLFAKQGRPNAFVKSTTRGFVAFTLVANGIAGFPDMIAVLLHIPAPLGIVVITEVTRQALVRQAKRDAGEHEFEPIPLTRWFLAPVSTFLLWRWRVLHDIRSYHEALNTDVVRRDALAMLGDLSDTQRRQVPGYLRRRLRTGMHVHHTAHAVRSLVSTLTLGAHIPVHPRPAPARPQTHPRTGSGQAVHTASTWTPTPDVDEGVYQSPERVDADVDPDLFGPAPTEVAPAPATASAPVSEDSGVDGVDQAPHGGPDTSPIHMDTLWQTEDAHHSTPADDKDEGPDGDDDGPRGGGGGARAPQAPQHVGADQAVTGTGPSPLDVARVGLDAPTWDDATTKKAAVFALLWECSGDVTAVRAVYADRTGHEVPRELYRQGRRGYAWSWHHDVAAYLVSRHGDPDQVRAILAAAGVDLSHDGIHAALTEWQDEHTHVVPFRRVPQ